MPLDRPIPAFYCCYLLRSTVRHARVYVGSTPNPVRRLDQHNGITKGGAARTNRDTLRPWEMTCIVTGFPSHIAALQFEWAWQNPHITLHIPPESRIQHATQKKRSGHLKRPQHTVSSLLSNLHLLLRVPSFSRWPLDVRFFNEDVHKAWLKWTKAVSEPIADSVPIITDFPSAEPRGPERGGSPKSKRSKTEHGISMLDVDYTKDKDYVKKGKEVVDFEREGACTICQRELEHDAGIYTICPSPGCEAVTHMTCLSTSFLKNDPDSLIPINGTCPTCRTELRWIDVVKELSLRMRGQKEVEKLLKVKRARKGKTVASLSTIVSDIEDDEDDVEMEREIAQEIKRLQEFNPTGAQIDMGDRWHDFEDSDDTDAGSVTSAASQSKPNRKRKESRSESAPSKAVILDAVIEDSDWDDALVLD
ncbi:Structure-specific endonuclease subunit slx1 [Hyphodiscus hymeniophilus]|uniref:Structure-specific endonuclease subunit slx1 n=1 Tax=Hyphodiscus hymeniophilus TaxID=353542 RepID=A0A9P6VEL1_9HELO|nr:Structure-specific endonuclease subunit slx1 [Hyphodiscus hymeniophilus]